VLGRPEVGAGAGPDRVPVQHDLVDDVVGLHVEVEHRVPDLPEHRWPSVPVCDHFEGQELAFCWNFLRTPRQVFYSLDERPGFLRLRLHSHHDKEGTQTDRHPVQSSFHLVLLSSILNPTAI